jgi:ubiquinone/menaquinone biosynthesis C-methylase UbiE
MQRRPTSELLDTDAGTAKEIEGSLRDLRWFNRWFGGITTSRNLIERVAEKTGRKEFSVLEVAAGEGFLPSQVSSYVLRSGIRIKTTLLDRAVSHLPRNGAMPKLAGDAMQLPFRESSFDLVASSLFVHHLSPQQVVAFARENLRVCRAAVLVHDLIRHPLHLAVAYAGFPIYRSRITRNDAPASVRQAYTVDEMCSFWKHAGAAGVNVTRNYFFRMGVIAWKQRPR